MKVSCQEPCVTSGNKAYYISEAQNIFVKKDELVNFLIEDVEGSCSVVRIEIRFEQVDLEHTPVSRCPACQPPSNKADSHQISVLNVNEDPETYSVRYFQSEGGPGVAEVTFLDEVEFSSHSLDVSFTCSASHHGQKKKYRLSFSSRKSSSEMVGEAAPFYVHVHACPKRSFDAFEVEHQDPSRLARPVQKVKLEGGTGNLKDYIVILPPDSEGELSSWVQQKGGDYKRVD